MQNDTVRCDFTLLSLFFDQELSCTIPLVQHLQTCRACQSWLEQVGKTERRIYMYEKEQQNFVLIEMFDVGRQRRHAEELGWEGLWLGQGADGEFTCQTAHAPSSLYFYLQLFWHGQTGIYVKNLDFPAPVLLHRGKRYLPLPAHHSKRIIGDDGLIVQEAGTPRLKLTLQLPGNLKENSITRKDKMLSQVSGSFIARFFQKVTPEVDPWRDWKMVRQNLGARQLAMYLMHLKGTASYKKIAVTFHVSPHQVAQLIAGIRSKLAGGVSTAGPQKGKL